ncbi:MAG: L-serine ammonia-lyase, iron-sulfur-dependent subunit beta [Defluviitaleaceae bacterium]|nr:L-serine ammonia-lyase, iron-sulfur-dependent subunit beta [Defluviitaleaceae bacterium]
MHIFDILGPIMIGPSSSHTAGVVRIGNVARRILGGTPSHALIQFHGSLAKTYWGHGSDKAIVAGLMGYLPDDMRIRDSLKLAKQNEFSYDIETVEFADGHPNTVILHLSCKESTNAFTLQAASVGGGNILVQKLNDIDVFFTGYYDTLIISHQDMPGAVSLVANVLAVEKINIAEMKLYRSKKGGTAIMVIEVDGHMEKRVVSALSSLPLIEKVTLLSGMSS